MFTTENFAPPCSITSMAKESIKSTNMLYDYVIIESVCCTLTVVKGKKKRNEFFSFPFLRTKMIKRKNSEQA